MLTLSVHTNQINDNTRQLFNKIYTIQRQAALPMIVYVEATMQVFRDILL